MEWAVTIEGRSNPGAILVLIDERGEAESIASEIRGRGRRVVVRPHPQSGPARVAPVS
jgi:hypothetical protein